MNKPIDKQQLADDLLHLSEVMLSAAQAARWEEMERMEEQRKQMLALLFADAEPISRDFARLASVLRDVQVVGEALMELVACERDRAGQELLNLRNARKAEAIYAMALDEGAQL